ncbi:MAG: hypothetical protein ACLSGI_03760 [Butyricicoccaceae bacterium]
MEAAMIAAPCARSAAPLAEVELL